MKKSTLILFIGYVWAKLLVGFIVSPYKSVREASSQFVLLPVIFSPIYGLAILFFLGRIGAYLFTTYGLSRYIIGMGLSAALFSVLLWQLLILYFFLYRHSFKYS